LKKYFFGFFLPENTTSLFTGNQIPKKYFSVKKFRDLGVGVEKLARKLFDYYLHVQFLIKKKEHVL